MPLLHQDNSRGGGGANENRRSIAEILGLDTRVDPPNTSRNNDRGGNRADYMWESPSSPEVAQTPRSLVPSNCFPPTHPRAFTSFSESAQPGAGWSDEIGPQRGITDLVSSLKALAIPSSGPASVGVMSPPHGVTYERLNNSVDNWSERSTGSLMRDDNPNFVARRASFCGSVGTAGRALRWEGVLPTRGGEYAGEYSPKLFLGGLPWDVTEDALMYALRQFKPVRVEWPGTEGARGFAYVTLESGRRVRALLAACRRDAATGSWFYRLHSRKRQPKQVEVIPWAVCWANWVGVGSVRLAAARTVFVGALHGMLSAPALAHIMNDLFSGVVYAGIDTDKNKYPIGSGRVTFDNVHSYVRAISAAYIEIHTDKFTKKVQVDPYLEDSMCSVCNLQQGPYFCREPTCFGYYCRSCWSCQHPAEEHKPLMRSSKQAVTSHAHAHPHIYHEGYPTPSEGTPSPSTSGTSASDAEAGAEGWVH